MSAERTGLLVKASPLGQEATITINGEVVLRGKVTMVYENNHTKWLELKVEGPQVVEVPSALSAEERARLHPATDARKLEPDAGTVSLVE